MSATILGAIAAQTGASASWTDGTSIVGWASDGSGQHGALWTVASPTTTPTILGADATFTFNVNAAGVDGSYIVGSGLDVSSNSYAFLWSTSSPTSAPTRLGNDIQGIATAVSGTRIVGYVNAGPTYAAMWSATSPATAATHLGSITGQTSAFAISINGTRIVGYASDATTTYAVLWDATNPTAAPTVLAAGSGHSYNANYMTEAFGVNGTRIVGIYRDFLATNTSDFPLMWDATNPSNPPVALGLTTPNDFISDAYAVDSTSGLIVGYAEPNNDVAVTWSVTSPSTITVLDPISGSTPGVSNSYANAINGTHIVGQAQNGSGNQAVLWSPAVPPPVVSVKIAGTEHYLDAPFKIGATGQSLIKIEVTAPGVARANLMLYDPTNSITVNDNDDLVILDESISGNAFLGNVQTRQLDIGANYRWWTITAVDLNSWLDTIIVGAPDGTQFLEDPPGTFTPYDPNAVSQASDSATVQWLFAKYASFLGIDTTTFVSTLVPNLSAIPIRWNEVTLRSALNDVAALVSPLLRYWIDSNAAFHWTVQPLAPLPASGTTTPGPLRMMFPQVVPGTYTTITLTDGVANHTTSFNYENLKLAYDDSGWADLVYVSGATTYTRKRTYIVEYLGGGLYQGWTGTDHVYGDVFPSPSSLTVRSTPSDSGTSLGTLNVGAIVVTTGYETGQGSYTFSGTQTDWYSILYKNQTGWIHAHGTQPYNSAGLVTGTTFSCDGTLQVRTIPATTTPIWKQEWATGTPTTPTGVRFDPTQPDRLFVCQGQYPYLYCLKLADRSVISKTYMGRTIPWASGISSDPNDASIYWMLNSPFEFGGTTTGCFFAKLSATDNSLLAKYSLPDGRWTDIRVSGSFIWLTNLDDDKFHKYSKTTFTEDQAYTIVYNGKTQVNPTGTYVDTDGATTTLGYFFLNGSLILRADETAPTTITGSQSTKGTDLLGGDMNSLSHAQLFACDPLTNRTYAYGLQLTTPATSISYYAIQQPGGTFDRYWMPAQSTRCTLLSTIYSDSTGGSGWVDPLTNDAGVVVGGTPATTSVTKPRQRLLTANNSDSVSTRDSFGGSALDVASQAVVRGSCTVYVTSGGWLPGLALSLTATPAGLTSALFMAQKTTTTFLSGVGYRKVDLEFGNAPVGTIGLRRNAQIPPGTKARRPTLRMEVLASNNTPGPGGSVRITAQAIDQSGNPWPIVGKTVVWTLNVYDTSGNEVTPIVTYSFDPPSSVTNVYGQAWTYLTVDTPTGLSYYVTATAAT